MQFKYKKVKQKNKHKKSNVYTCVCVLRLIKNFYWKRDRVARSLVAKKNLFNINIYCCKNKKYKQVMSFGGQEFITEKRKKNQFE